MALDERAVKFHTLGNTLVAEQKYNEAIQNYLKAIDIAPNYDAAVYHLAEAYEAKQLDDEAVKHYTRAIALNPTYATIHIEAGLDSLLSGPLGKAVAAFKKDLKESGALKGAPDGGSATLMDHQSAGEYDGPMAQKGLTPRKLVVEEADKPLQSVVATHDTITARVLGDRDVPVLECPVTFQIDSQDERLGDGALAKTMELLKKAPQKKLTLATDDNGFATVHFLRSQFAGKNIVKIVAAGLPEILVEDNTRGSAITDADITPAESAFSAGEAVAFTAHLKDKFGNHVAGREVQFTLTERQDKAWNMIDAVTVTSDESGNATHTFNLPTHSGIECRLQVIDKQAKFTRRHDFKLISSAVGSALFIPMMGKVEAGKSFALKAKLLDEYDNPVVGRRASIVVQDSSGEHWEVKASDGATGQDGSILFSIVPPIQEGARVVFTIQARGLEPGAYTASFETVPGDAADSMASSMSAAPEKPRSESSLGGLPMPDVSGSGITSEFMDSLLPRPSVESVKTSRPLMGPGLEDMDFEVSSPDFARTGTVPLSPEPNAGPASGSALDALDSMLDSGIGDSDAGALPMEFEPPAIIDPVSGSAFDALGDMLDSESPHEGADMPLHGEIPEYGEPQDLSGDSGLLLPEDAGEPDSGVSVHDYGLDEPADAEIPLPDDDPAMPAPFPAGSVSEILVEKDQFTCRVGDTIHLSLTALDADGSPRATGVNAMFRIVEEPMDSDACFLLEHDNPGDKTYKISSDGSQYLNATLQAPTVIGDMTLEAGVGSLVKPITVQVLPGEADRIELSAAESRVAPDEMTVVSAHVYDRYDNPLQGENVTFTVYDTKGQGGWLEEPVTVTTDGTGLAQATFIGGGNSGDLTIVTASHDMVISQSVQKVTIETAETEEQANATVQDSGGTYNQYEEQNPLLEYNPDAAPAMMGGPEIPAPIAPPVPDLQSGLDAYPPHPTAAPPMPPMPQAAPQMPPFQQPGLAPPVPPTISGGMEYMHDDLSAPEANGPYRNDYVDGSELPVYDQDELTPEDYYEIEDPYAVPKFEVQKGRKPALDFNELLPKVIKVLGALLLAASIVWAGFKSANGILYQINFNKANKLYNQQQGDKALIYYEKCTEIKPKQIEPYTRMSEIYMTAAAATNSPVKKDRMLVNAAKLLNAGINHNPDSVDALYNLCRVYKIQENYNQCAKYCGQALLVDPKFEAAQSDQQECLDNAGY